MSLDFVFGGELFHLVVHVAVVVIVSVWNSLPDSVESAESVNSFKSRLDKF